MSLTGLEAVFCFFLVFCFLWRVWPKAKSRSCSRKSPNGLPAPTRTRILLPASPTIPTRKNPGPHLRLHSLQLLPAHKSHTPTRSPPMADTPASTPPLQPQPVQSSKPVSEALLNDKVLHPLPIHSMQLRKRRKRRTNLANPTRIHSGTTQSHPSLSAPPSVSPSASSSPCCSSSEEPGLCSPDWVSAPGGLGRKPMVCCTRLPSPSGEHQATGKNDALRERIR